MTARTLTAMFSDRGEAERAGEMLMSELQLNRSAIRVNPTEGATDAGYDAARPYDDKGFFGAIKDLFVPDEDRYGYAEGMRRGGVLLSAQVDEAQSSRASDILEHAGAWDLDAQEASWRKLGWTGYDASAHAAARGTATTVGAAAANGGGNDAIKVVEERLSVGKRVTEGGSVRVRSYVVERPAEVQVTLRGESVRVERHPVDRVATMGDQFESRTIEARGMEEVPVVSKEARIIEEIHLRKDVADRTETVSDTLRKTEVDVQDTAATARTTGPASVTPAEGPLGGRTAGAATGVAGAVDRTLNTNVSGTNPGTDAPDGTAGNPKGTMASRAVDKTLGTNISGANPEHKA
jgi:uncharacterized protein (TIGR02271 family)